MIRVILKSLATIGVTLAMLWAESASAMDFTFEYTDNRPLFPPAVWVEMDGPIEAGDTARFLAKLAPFTDREIYEVVLNIDSPGGNLVESLRLGQTIADLPYITRANVGTNNGQQICASACVNVYLGADYRFLSQTARIGVHQFSMDGENLNSNDAISISQDLSSRIIGHLHAMRADPAFFNLMVATHSEDIYWVPRTTLEDLHVVTNGIYAETAEYRNVNGSIALYLKQVSLVGTNTATLMCGDKGLVGIFDLNEPEYANIGYLDLYVDGSTFRLDDFKVIDRRAFRFKAVSLFPTKMLGRLASARELGARVTSIDGNMFLGFEGGVRDAKIAETVRGCLTNLENSTPPMTRHQDVDFIGGDLTKTGYRDVSFAECEEICLGNNHCVGVSYVRSKRWCWPKGQIVTSKQKHGVTSALRN